MFVTLLSIFAGLNFGCTISFQNICTGQGSKEDDTQSQKASPDIKTDLQIPVKAI